MKRALTFALLMLATSGVVSAQIRGVPPSVSSFGAGRGPTPGVPASITSLGPLGFGDTFFNKGFSGGFAFGHHPRFIAGFHKRSHRHFFPAIVIPYYVPYYTSDYAFESYDLSAYQQPQSTQPIVVVVDSKSSDSRYGDHTFAEQRSAPAPQVQPQAPPAPAREQAPTVLVFRDGHKQEVRNYAIVGQMLWDFSAKGTRKIPLSDLDLDSTRTLNDERGVDFVLPKS